MSEIQWVFERISEKFSDEETKSFWWIFKTTATKKTDNLKIFKKAKESAL